MHRKTLETPVSSKTIFSHPGISYRPDKKDRFEFSDDAKEVLKQFIKNRFQGHDMEQESWEKKVNPDKTFISTEQVQATVDGLLSKWKSKWKILDFLEKVRKVFQNTDTKPSSQFPEKIREKIEKNTKNERLDIYLEIDGKIVDVPLIVWKWDIHITNIINTFNTRCGYHELIGNRKNK